VHAPRTKLRRLSNQCRVRCEVIGGAINPSPLFISYKPYPQTFEPMKDALNYIDTLRTFEA